MSHYWSWSSRSKTYRNYTKHQKYTLYVASLMSAHLSFQLNEYMEKKKTIFFLIEECISVWYESCNVEQWSLSAVIMYICIVYAYYIERLCVCVCVRRQPFSFFFVEQIICAKKYTNESGQVWITAFNINDKGIVIRIILYTYISSVSWMLVCILGGHFGCMFVCTVSCIPIN